jgi:hypothetical protein
MAFLLGALVVGNFGMWGTSVPPAICTDNIREDAFHSIKNDIEYCFYRKRDYPYRISGGIIGVN